MAASWGAPDTGAGLGGRGAAAAAGMEAAQETWTSTSNWMYDNNTSTSNSSTTDTCSGSATCVLTFLHDKIQTLALLLLSLQLTYVLLDRVGKWWVAKIRRTTKGRAATPITTTSSSSHHKQPMVFASPSVFMTSPRPSSSTQPSPLTKKLVLTYALSRRKARQLYWQMHNACQRLYKEWGPFLSSFLDFDIYDLSDHTHTGKEGGQEEEEEEEDEKNQDGKENEGDGEELDVNKGNGLAAGQQQQQQQQSRRRSRKGQNHLGGLLVSCLFLPLFTGLALRFLTLQLLPFLLSLLRFLQHSLLFLLSLHWRAGQGLARGMAAVFSHALPPPFDLLALLMALVGLTGREQQRHARGETFGWWVWNQAVNMWVNRAVVSVRAQWAFRRYLHQSALWREGRKGWRAGRRGWEETKEQVWEQVVAGKRLYRRVCRVVGWVGGLLVGGREGGRGLGRSVSLEQLEKEWGAIPPFPVRRAAGACGICQERHAVLFVVSAECAHAFCRGCTSGYLTTLLASGPFPARCPTCRVEDSVATTPRRGGGGGGGEGGEEEGHEQHLTGLCTRSVLKSLAAEGVTTPHHARRFLLQQCRAVGDESTQDVIARTSKRCPSCAQPTTHYRNHGCHHIKPGTGCPSCGHHWCFLCLHDSGLEWKGCPNECRLYCDDACSCPKCPDCQPGLPCEACDRDCPSCRLHA